MSKLHPKTDREALLRQRRLDLMAMAPGDVESVLARILRMGRAVGVHCIISTERPEVDVITSTIAGNIPARIALRVASRVDSRTILDALGAEKLLGKGDLLYLEAGEVLIRRLLVIAPEESAQISVIGVVFTSDLFQRPQSQAVLLDVAATLRIGYERERFRARERRVCPDDAKRETLQKFRTQDRAVAAHLRPSLNEFVKDRLQRIRWKYFRSATG